MSVGAVTKTGLVDSEHEADEKNIEIRYLPTTGSLIRSVFYIDCFKGDRILPGWTNWFFIPILLYYGLLFYSIILAGTQPYGVIMLFILIPVLLILPVLLGLMLSQMFVYFFRNKKTVVRPVFKGHESGFILTDDDAYFSIGASGRLKVYYRYPWNSLYVMDINEKDHTIGFVSGKRFHWIDAGSEEKFEAIKDFITKKTKIVENRRKKISPRKFIRGAVILVLFVCIWLVGSILFNGSYAFPVGDDFCDICDQTAYMTINELNDKGTVVKTVNEYCVFHGAMWTTLHPIKALLIGDYRGNLLTSIIKDPFTVLALESISVYGFAILAVLWYSWRPFIRYRPYEA